MEIQPLPLDVKEEVGIPGCYHCAPMRMKVSDLERGIVDSGAVFLGDNDLLDQMTLMPLLLLEFPLLSDVLPHYLRQLGFLLPAAEVILIDTCGSQIRFDPGSGFVSAKIVLSLSPLCVLYFLVIGILVKVLHRNKINGRSINLSILISTSIFLYIDISISIISIYYLSK